MPISAHYLKEVKRKSLHLSSLWIPLVYFFLPKDIMLTWLLGLTVAILILDIGRHYSWYLGNIFYTLCGKLLRPHEVESTAVRLTGASYLMASSLLVIALFSKVIAVTALCVLMVSDSSAALIGKRFGKRPLVGKTMEGTAAFVLSGFVVVAIAGQLFPVNYTYYIAASLAVCVGAATELYSKKFNVDDNFTIPLSVAAVMWLIVFILQG